MKPHNEPSSTWRYTYSPLLSSLHFNDLWRRHEPRVWMFTCASTLSLDWIQTSFEQNQKSAQPLWTRICKNFSSIQSTSTHPSLPLPISPPTPILQVPLALKSGLYETVAWQRVYVLNGYLCVGVCGWSASLQVRVCAKCALCRSLAFVILSTATLSFIRALSCSPQTLSIQFHSLGPLSAVARGWMISNTWEPWEPTQSWNNRGPVSMRAVEEDETAGGDDVRIIHTLPHFICPSWLSVRGMDARIQKHPRVQKN